MAVLDSDGQPLITGYNLNRRINRSLNELTGLLRGIMADGVITSVECDALAKWVLGNTEIKDIWPVNVLVERLNRIYADGVVTDEERIDLADLVSHIIGQQDDETFSFTPTDLPLTIPAPEVVFESSEFVLTGKFLYGTRKQCQREIEVRGGRCADTVRLRTNYVVIGSLMSRDWKYTTHGTKIETAIEYAKRCPIAIIAEQHWQQFLLPSHCQIG